MRKKSFVCVLLCFALGACNVASESTKNAEWIELQNDNSIVIKNEGGQFMTSEWIVSEAETPWPEPVIPLFRRIDNDALRGVQHHYEPHGLFAMRGDGYAVIAFNQFDKLWAYVIYLPGNYVFPPAPPVFEGGNTELIDKDRRLIEMNGDLGENAESVRVWRSGQNFRMEVHRKSSNAIFELVPNIYACEWKNMNS